MKECGIVKDLLPLYQEGMLSADSVEFLEEHLKLCPACRAEREGMTEEIPLPEDDGKAPEWENVRRKLYHRQRRMILFAVCLALALATATFARLTERHYFTEPKGIVHVASQTGSGRKVLRFTRDVTGAESAYRQTEDGKSVIFLSVWWTEWDRLFGNTLSETPAPEADSVYFSPNNGTDDILLWGEDQAPGGGMITLPRLALGYYAGLALILLAALCALTLILRKRSCGRWLRRAAMLPAAYLLGELLVMGFSTVTYSMERDVALILITALFLAPTLLAADCLREERQRQALPEQI